MGSILFLLFIEPVSEIKPTFSDYIENLVYTTCGYRHLFQMPLLVAVLARIRIVTARFLKTIPIDMLLSSYSLLQPSSAPSTDPFSLTLVAIPLYALYEASIIIASQDQ